MKKTVLTLDAGGTNFVFSAMEDYQEVVSPIRLDSCADNIDDCLAQIVKGFNMVKQQLAYEHDAISFAFPGPADYERGVIGDLGNLPAFRGGIALGPYLEREFGIPVYINNDGNLFAYGEALAGFLPEVNEALRASGSERQYRNVVGITLGTGFGCGVVLDGILLRGDNSCGGDVWCTRNKLYPEMIAEESVSIRAVKRVYEERSSLSAAELTPYDIFLIAEGERDGNATAARDAFRELGTAIGETLVNVLKVYNWEDAAQRKEFLSSGVEQVKIPRSETCVPYLKERSICVGLSKNGASKSIMYGAYAYAARQLQIKEKQHE